MKKIEYRCNLCKEVNKKPHIISYTWNSSIIPQGYILSDNIDSSDTHICVECVNVIVNHIKSLS